MNLDRHHHSTMSMTQIDITSSLHQDSDSMEAMGDDGVDESQQTSGPADRRQTRGSGGRFGPPLRRPLRRRRWLG